MAAGAGLSEYTALPYGAGHPGLEPGIAGFGDRCLCHSPFKSASHSACTSREDRGRISLGWPELCWGPQV